MWPAKLLAPTPERLLRRSAPRNDSLDCHCDRSEAISCGLCSVFPRRLCNQRRLVVLEGAAEHFAGFGDRRGGADLDPVGHLVARCAGAAMLAQCLGPDLRAGERHDEGEDRLATLAARGT